MTVERFCELSATLICPGENLKEFGRTGSGMGVVEFGTKVLKTGQVARWGQNIAKKDLAFVQHSTRKGVYQIHDPGTNFVATVARGDDVGANSADNWLRRKKKYAYIADISLPKEHQNTIKGGQSLLKFNQTLFPHLDRRGITAATTAGAFKEASPLARERVTADLVRGYQRRAGFKLDRRSTGDNEYNIGMIRRPNPGQVPVSSYDQIARHVANSRERGRLQNRAAIRDNISPVAAGVAGITAGGAGALAATASKPKDDKSSNAKKLTIGASTIAASAGAAGLYHKREEVKQVVGATYALLDENRLRLGKRIASRRPFIGKQILRGFV